MSALAEIESHNAPIFDVAPIFCIFRMSFFLCFSALRPCLGSIIYSATGTVFELWLVYSSMLYFALVGYSFWYEFLLLSLVVEKYLKYE